MIARPLLLFLLVLPALAALTQSDTAWYRVDSLIARKSNLQDLRRELFQWKQQAVQQQDHATAARCLYNLMLIADQTSEDTLYFKYFVSTIMPGMRLHLPLFCMRAIRSKQR